MSSDTVKPIPPSVATTARSPRGRAARRSDAGTSRDPRMPPAPIPSTLPIGSAIARARKTGLHASPPTAGTTTSDAVKANRGSTTAFDQGSRTCRTRSAACGAMMSPSATPAIVACTPESSTRSHAARPSSTSTGMSTRLPRPSTRWLRKPNTRMTGTAARSGSGARSVVKKNAMRTIAMRSSMTARARRNARTRAGRPRATSDSTPSANAMSVAVGIGQPAARAGSGTSRRKITAGAMTPPTAAMTGMNALRGLSSSPRVSSCRSSIAARKKKTARSPSVIQCPPERWMPSQGMSRYVSRTPRMPSPTGELASTSPSAAASTSRAADSRSERKITGYSRLSTTLSASADQTSRHSAVEPTGRIGGVLAADPWRPETRCLHRSGGCNTSETLPERCRNLPSAN